MLYKKYVFYFFILIFCFTNCGKYPDGPDFSLRTKRARVLGEYKVELFSVNGDDSTSLLTCHDYTFIDKGNREISWCGHTSSAGGYEWELFNHNKNISISVILDSTERTPFPISYHNPYNFGSTISWEIQRLTNNQMWLKTNFNSKEYYIKFYQK